ncbi:MAG TPA: hypothetical protein VFN38_00575, partial [Gemmatimonadaceae bacterium]|nr:hypothetical protein [Gemmatimonadaceae bacterium]
MPEGDEPIPNLAGTAERGSERTLIRVQWRHRHHAFDTQTTQFQPSFPFGRRLGGRQPAFRSLAGDVHLHQTSHVASAILAHPRDRVGEPGAVDRMHEVEPLDRLRLVPLQMADEVPSNRHIDLSHLGQRFLHPVFADVRDTEIPRRSDGVGSVRLGDRDDRHWLAMTTASDRRRYPLPH